MVSILEGNLESYTKTKFDMNVDVISRLKTFLENEARSCSIDFGCVTPLYVYRMWGGTVALEDIENGLKEIKNGCR